jgi:DNA polymerase-1
MAAKPERVVLVDGSWLVYRAFFAIPSSFATASGLHTNAIYGFATMFRKLFAQKRPAMGAVVFDPPGPTQRDAAFPAYKAQRPAMPDPLREQLPWIDRLVRAHGFPIVRVPGWEGDDVVGTLAQQARDAGHEVLLVAGDKDFAQLVGDGVRMFDPMRDVTFDATLVFKKWGVRPEQVVDLLALVGDSVDNIPGVPGIGEKGATALLGKYGDLDGVYAHLAELPARQRAALEANRPAAETSRALATIRRDAPIGLRVEDLAIPAPDAAAEALYRELEFHSLLKGTEAEPGDEPVVELDDDFAFDGVVAIAPALAGTEGGAGVLTGLALATARGTAFTADPARLRGWLEDATQPKVTHDAKALWKALRRVGIALRGCDDTMIASFLVEPTKCVPHRLDQVAREYLHEATRPPAATPAGAVRAAAVVARLWPVLRERLGGLAEHYRARELPLAFVLGEMETDGIAVDAADLARMGEEFTARRTAIEQEIHRIAGRTFNVGSTQQLGAVLFEDLKLPVVKKTKTGWSTDAEVLEALAPKHEIARLVLEQRMLAKLVSTYTEVLQRAVDPATGRIHATFQQTTGVSGRLISTDPDLQRTPVRTPEGKRIRHAFVAPPGSVLVSADWSQIELRVLAHFSDDPGLVEAFREGRDVHRRTASELFGVAFDAVSPEQRNVGKTVNFATIYGQGATALGQILHVPRKEAQAHIEAFFRTYAGVRAWLDRTIAEASASGYVTTLLGRRRFIPELSSLNQVDRTAGERIAANTPIQGSAADLCKLAMLRIAAELRGRRARMLLQVHDELVLEVPEDELADVEALVRDAMEHPWPLKVPLVVNIGHGRTWGDAH